MLTRRAILAGSAAALASIKALPNVIVNAIAPHPMDQRMGWYLHDTLSFKISNRSLDTVMEELENDFIRAEEAKTPATYDTDLSTYLDNCVAELVTQYRAAVIGSSENDLPELRNARKVFGRYVELKRGSS